MSSPVFDPARLGPPPGARVAVVGGCGGMGRQLVQGLLEVLALIFSIPWGTTSIFLTKKMN